MHIDLNSDLGEGYGAWLLGDDEAMLDIVTSANVACGFHAGDPSTIRRTVQAAAERGVVVGAQVSYPDLAGFGRRRMDIAVEDLTADVLYQVGALSALCREAGTVVSYVKAHGALYNRIVDDDEQAGAVVAAMVAWGEPIPLLTLSGSVASAVAEAAGIPVVAEGFADRGYDGGGRLIPRSLPGAVLTDAATVASRALRMVTDGVVESADGADVRTQIHSLCVHGDTPGAVELATRIRSALQDAGVALRPFR